MLKRIRIDNCLSFDNFEIELEKVNVLIGKNSTGKSNFCHVLQFLRLSQEVNDLRDAAIRALGLNARFTNIYSKNNNTLVHSLIRFKNYGSIKLLALQAAKVIYHLLFFIFYLIIGN